MTLRDLTGNVPSVVDEGGANESNLEHIHNSTTEDASETTSQISYTTPNSQPLGVFSSHRLRRQSSG